MATEPSNVNAESIRNEELRKEATATAWKRKIEAACKVYDEWEKRFDCDKLEDMYEGQQWENDQFVHAPHGYRPYVVNLFFSSIETKIPNLLFKQPVYKASARPYGEDFDLENASKTSKLKEDVINSFVMDRRNIVSEVFEDVAYNSFFRFGLVEVGYSANWIENPNAGKPVLEEPELIEGDQNEAVVIKQPAKLPVDERIYVKSIDPKSFRFGGEDKFTLSQCDWVGYYEHYPTRDLKANTELNNLDKIQDKLQRTRIEYDSDGKQLGYEKIWHIWDNRTKRRYLIHHESGYTLKDVKFKRLPLFIYAPHKRRKKRTILPIPVAYNWVSPQEELNETRETARVQRRKLKRKYTVRRDAFENESDVIKVIHGGDGAYAFVDNNENPILPIPLPSVDPAARDAMITSKDDFNVISATTAEQRGESDRVTATQAQITNTKSDIRENHTRERFANYLCDVGREILLLHKEKLVNPFWVKRFADSMDSLFMEVQEHSFTWEQIIGEELESPGADFDLNINISSLSILAQEQEKKIFFEFLAVLNTYPQLAMSPQLIREAAERLGYRNETAIRHFQSMAMLQMVGAMEMMQGQSGLPQQNTQKSTPDTQTQIDNQLKNQTGRVQ